MNAPLLHQVLKTSALLWTSIREGKNLDVALQDRTIPAAQRSAAQSIVYETMRKKALLDDICPAFFRKEPAAEIYALTQVAIGQIICGKRNEFTVVDEAVKAAKTLSKNPRIAGLINAVLRSFCRQKTELLEKAALKDEVRFNAPAWWIKRYEDVFKETAHAVLSLQQEHPPLTVRAARNKISRDAYVAENPQTKAVGLDGVVFSSPLPVDQIPGFSSGLVSVQDAGSQLAAQILGAAPSMKVLDACAAPGGKTAHLAELGAKDVLALEVDRERAQRITENMLRLKLSCKTKVADASKPDLWWDKTPFDRILLDAPCTASGIVRRHPDIPWSRRPEDIKKLAGAQKRILDALWPTLKTGGRLLYSVCSVFPEEGIGQIKSFLSRTPDASLVAFPGAPDGCLLLSPEQSAPDTAGPLPWVHDGFFYALIEKNA
jgi:16S rRNA (cytosine967-C5)-methyltransferase